MLEVPTPLTPAWIALAPAVRARIESFLSREPSSHAAMVATDAPAPFADDLRRGGSGLRAAFPALVRRVVAIERGDRLAIRVASAGAHDGEFYGCLSASGREVSFDELHELALHGDEIVAHRIAIDLRAIVRQLGAPRAAARAIAC